MPEVEKFDLHEFINGLTKAVNKVAENYLRNFSGYHHDIRDIFMTYSSLWTKTAASPDELVKLYNFYLDYQQQQQQLLNNIVFKSKPGSESTQLSDKRFLAPEWKEIPWFNFISQNHLLLEKLARRIINEAEVNTRSRKKLEFYTDHYLGVLAPSNYLLTNPEALKLAIETKGKSLWNGFNNLISDMEKGQISQTDETAFTVGKNLAITPGDVVFENELIQLIQYSATTKKVHAIPLLIIPPWINKYYILDLQPKNSFVKFMVDNGFTVYIISWRNPSRKMRGVMFDDYVQKGALEAIEVAKAISGAQKINTLGYCLGGTLLGIASAILSAKEKESENPVNSATFLAAMLDFSDIGPMGDVIDSALVKKIERGELTKGGVMHGHDMETAFNLIRANDLIWNYVVNNYLKGKKPAPVDVIYWTNDNTNLPAGMYTFYMRKMILENKLSRKNALRICNTPIDIGKIKFPVYVIGFYDDHISPWKTAFTTTELVSGPVKFVLGLSGHVMGVVNPPEKKKYGFYHDGRAEEGFEEWLKTAELTDGSWWNAWAEWLKGNSGEEITAPLKNGNKKYHPIEKAPGKYVLEKCGPLHH